MLTDNKSFAVKAKKYLSQHLKINIPMNMKMQVLILKCLILMQLLV